MTTIIKHPDISLLRAPGFVPGCMLVNHSPMSLYSNISDIDKDEVYGFILVQGEKNYSSVPIGSSIILLGNVLREYTYFKQIIKRGWFEEDTVYEIRELREVFGEPGFFKGRDIHSSYSFELMLVLYKEDMFMLKFTETTLLQFDLIK